MKLCRLAGLLLLVISWTAFGFKNVSQEAMDKWGNTFGFGIIMLGEGYDEHPCSIKIVNQGEKDYTIQLFIIGPKNQLSSIEIDPNEMSFDRLRDIATGQRFLGWKPEKNLQVRFWLDLENEIKSFTFHSASGTFIDGCYGPFFKE